MLKTCKEFKFQHHLLVPIFISFIKGKTKHSGREGRGIEGNDYDDAQDAAQGGYCHDHFGDDDDSDRDYGDAYEKAGVSVAKVGSVLHHR